MNEITIRGLRVSTHIGVPDCERAQPQQLEVDVVIEPRHAFSDMDDNIFQTVDYAAVAQRIVSLAAERPRHLIETLAVEIAQTILQEFQTRTVTVEIRKSILPQTDHVAVRCRVSAES